MIIDQNKRNEIEGQTKANLFISSTAGNWILLVFEKYALSFIRTIL